MYFTRILSTFNTSSKEVEVGLAIVLFKRTTVVFSFFTPPPTYR